MKIRKRPVSPRQKMINLMYVVLMAMLALNVSSDVLQGFSLVEDSLSRTTRNSSKENEAIYADLAQQMRQNPVKVREWLNKAMTVRDISDSLYNYASELKLKIVRYADGKDGDPRDIRNKDNLEASTHVMLSGKHSEGRALFDAINRYREQILSMVTDKDKAAVIESNLSTQVPPKWKAQGKNWQEHMFENMPVAAAVTLLSKLQSDVRYAEGEVLHSLVSNIDLKDIRVNQLSAYVIPQAQTVVQGSRFSSRIIMAAVDTTCQPEIYVGGQRVAKNGIYEFTATKTGDFQFGGYIEMNNGQGERVRRDFTQKYSVVAPSATVSADIMNVLYAGYANPMSVSVPGIPNNKVTATMTGGTLQPTAPGKYIARPAKIGEDAVITIAAEMDGRRQEMGRFTFRVRRLPDPTAFIAHADEKGQPVHYRGGVPIYKAQLMGAKGIGAAIDDGLLNIEFKVLGFETVFFDNMGNAVPEVAQGSAFTERQKDLFRRLGRGKRFYISRVRALGPDGQERRLPQSLEVIVN